MTHKTFHWRSIERSAPLQLLLEILKDADGPLTQGDMQMEATRRGTILLNASTLVSEIGSNPGFEVSDGTWFGQKKGPAVRFPNGKYRYWLVSAPRWIPRWHVTRDFQISIGISLHNSGQGFSEENTPAKTEPIPNAVISSAQPVLICMNAMCGKNLSDDHIGAPFCDEQCKLEFFGLKG